MDKVVQQTAANAEETASSSEEMSAQAEQLESVVKDLVILARGGHANSTDADEKALMGAHQSRNLPLLQKREKQH